MDRKADYQSKDIWNGKAISAQFGHCERSLLQRVPNNRACIILGGANTLRLGVALSPAQDTLIRDFMV